MQLDTKKTIEYIAKKEDLFFLGYTSMTDDAAYILSRQKRQIWFPDLIEISEKSAEYFSRFHGFLEFRSLKKISTNSLYHLIKNKKRFSIGNLDYLSDEAAKILGDFSGNLTLGLRHLSDSVAEALSMHNGEDLVLYGFTEMSDKAAQYIAERGGELLALPDLKSLSESAAEAIFKRGHEVHLSGLEQLTDDAAIHMSKFSGEIYLDSVTNLSDWTAEALTGGKASLYLSGLTEINERVACALSKHRGYLDLSGLKELPLPIAVRLINHWEKIDYRFVGLGLNGLSSIDSNVAIVFYSYPGYILNLNGLRTMPLDVARLLSRSKCLLSLDGLEEFPEDSVRRFSKYRKKISGMTAKEFAEQINKSPITA